jgi:hypothetical protein
MYSCGSPAHCRACHPVLRDTRCGWGQYSGTDRGGYLVSSKTKAMMMVKTGVAGDRRDEGNAQGEVEPRKVDVAGDTKTAIEE